MSTTSAEVDSSNVVDDDAAEGGADAVNGDDAGDAATGASSV